MNVLIPLTLCIVDYGGRKGKNSWYVGNRSRPWSPAECQERCDCECPTRRSVLRAMMQSTEYGRLSIQTSRSLRVCGCHWINGVFEGLANRKSGQMKASE